MKADKDRAKLFQYWLCFSPDHDEEDARKRFENRFGVEPSEVITADFLIWVGPVPAEEKEYVNE